MEKINAKFTLWGSQWLNLVGQIVLIKAMLSALPIFQSASLLAPKSITNQITAKLTHFLWQGGKTDGNKLLILW